MFEIPAGGRRYRALELLVKQKRLARTAPIPCVVREGGVPEEDSLAENIQRAPLHPLDQFRAFQTLREKGQSEEAIAAAFFVSPTVLRVERGFVRPEDEPVIEAAPTPYADCEPSQAAVARVENEGQVVASGLAEPEEPEDDGVLKPIPDRLTTELTAHRTLALRRALGEQPDVALLGALHAMCLKLFFRYAADCCLDLDVRNVNVGDRGPYGLGDTELVRALDQRHQRWAAAVPKDPQDLWDTLTGFDLDSRQALFAHCVALSVNAVYDPYNRRPVALTHADRLAEALDLDMAAAGWRPTVDAYLGRVTKARILAAVREAQGEDAARGLEGMKKDDMAKTAEGLLTGSGWLPKPLRTPGRSFASAATSEPTTAAPAPEATRESSGVKSQPNDAVDGEHNDHVDGDDDARGADADGCQSDEDAEALAAAE